MGKKGQHWHRLLESDERTRMGVCALCGSVRIYRQKLYGNEEGRYIWRCSRHPERRPRHVLNDIDAESRTAECSVCGAVNIYPMHRSGKIVWQCAIKKQDESQKSIKNIGGQSVRNLRNQASRYGITPEEIEAVTSCQICGDEFKPGVMRKAVDHDHRTGKVRGILCGRCNIGLGQFRDRIELLEQAITYLQTHIDPGPSEEETGAEVTDQAGQIVAGTAAVAAGPPGN